MPFWPGWPGMKKPEKPPEGTFYCPACKTSKPERFMDVAPPGSEWHGQNICRDCRWKEQIALANVRLKREAEK